VAVDDVLEDGEGLRSTLTGEPSDIALTLAWCCDEITGAEYTSGGERRVVA
jgi:hypothetical protein